MRNAERGASQVPLVICVFLLLIAGFFAFDENSKRTIAEERLNKITAVAKDPDSSSPATDQKVMDLIRDGQKGPAAVIRLGEIAEVTGGREDENPELVVSPNKIAQARDRLMTALDSGEFVIEIPLERFIESPDTNIKVIKEEKSVKINLGGTRELRGAKPEVVSVLDVVVIPALQRCASLVKLYAQANEASKAAKAAADAAYAQALSGKDAQIQSKVEETAALEARKAEELSRVTRERDDALAGKSAAEEELDRVKSERSIEVAGLTADLQRKAAEVQVLKQRKRAVETDTSPDGTVIAVGTNQSSVIIDLGKVNNNLLPGTTFDVYAIGKGGQEIPKGAIKVLRVGPATSDGKVTAAYDSREPIIPGDRIRSMTYSPSEVIHVALVGRFSRMGRSDAAARLKALGVVVDEKVGVSTHYLVVGSDESDTQPVQESEAYKAAELYGVTMISENELSRFTAY